MTRPLQAFPLLACVALASCNVLAQSEPAETWAHRAERAQRALVERFWNDRSDLFENSGPKDDEDQKFHYWWQALAIDVLVDGFERSGDRDMLARAGKVWAGVKRRNGGVTNDYYDDMLWMGLALQRLHAQTDDALVQKDIATLWQDIRTGWNDQQGGGIAWRKSQRDYKNTPANAPAVILAVRLHRQHEDEQDLEFAKRIYRWIDRNLVDPDTGFVWDGKNRRGDGRTDKGWAFTYNQGTRIGAAIELHRATGDAHFLADARKTFHALSERLVDADGVLTERGRGDGGLFKGILIRYLGELATVDDESRAEVRAFIVRQAEALWSHLDEDARSGDGPLLFPDTWNQPVTTPVALSVQLSGIMLFEQMAKIRQAPGKAPAPVRHG